MHANFKAAILMAASSLLIGAQASAATFVYVSNSEDGDIGTYTLQSDGSLEAGPHVGAEKLVMPMPVSPDKRFLIAGVRSKPFSAYTYGIDRRNGSLKLVGTGPLAESFPYISLDRTGRFLLGASYAGHLVSVNPVGADGRVGEPLQVIPTARNAHAIRTDNTNRFVFVPHLGTDQVFQFLFDEKSGRLTANTPPVAQMKAGTGPRHLITSPDNRFVYLLNELTATVTTLALDGKTGTLKEVSSASALPPDSKLVPGAPRPSPGRNTDNDIWASDLHLTPNGKFLYAAERTSSRSEEHTSELQSQSNLVCRLLLEKKKTTDHTRRYRHGTVHPATTRHRPAAQNQRRHRPVHPGLLPQARAPHGLPERSLSSRVRRS